MFWYVAIIHEGWKVKLQSLITSARPRRPLSDSPQTFPQTEKRAYCSADNKGLRTAQQIFSFLVQQRPQFWSSS